MVKVFLGSDHAGFDLKEKIKIYLKKSKIPFLDIGPKKKVPGDDYPDYAFKVAQKVSSNKNFRGILVCGTGTGMTIAANKVKGIRAVSAYDSYSAKMSRADNNTNVLGLRGRFFSDIKAKSIVSIWLKTKFSNKNNHNRRLRKIAKFEK